ncbi:hypothetical protein QE152_g32665 [Popillia japonica]|uniref:Uncharacterized protein n=1 Tax=Popillia japonica TaxID=7064 RepID=A0AAW1IYB9_POPJA
MANFQNIHPHCTHRIQPLDVAVMGPFKSKYSLAQNDWFLTNPGKTITIHDVAELANIAFVNSFTIKNIPLDLLKVGYGQFPEMFFSDEDFEAAFVTDRSFAQDTQTEHIAQNSNGTNTQHPDLKKMNTK